MAPPVTTNPLSIAPQPYIQNISNFVPVKLTRENYLLWKSLFTPILKSYKLYGFVDGSNPCPPQFLPDDKGLPTSTINPKYEDWVTLDQTLLIWINASLSDPILPYVVGCNSSKDVWCVLERRFATVFRSHTIHLKSKLQSMRKTTQTISEYLQEIKQIADNLAAAGSPISDEDMILYMLKGLLAEYGPFVTSIKVRSDAISVDGLHNLITGEEISILEQNKVRAGVEMALIDAVANSIGLPLWRLFGGVSNSIKTDITIPIVSPNEAAALASEYRGRGFTTLKLKVGKNLKSDIEVLKSIRSVHPDCEFILDANEGYTANEAIEVLDKLHEMGVTPILFEQPVHRDNWEGLYHVSQVAKDTYGVSVAADESCRSIDDANRIIQGNLAHVINIKLAKSGVLGALEIIKVARGAGVALMIGGMVETRLAMGFAGHLAAGFGCFRYIDLDTPLLLSEDPVHGGYEVYGPVYKYANSRGHGGFLHWENNAQNTA